MEQFQLKRSSTKQSELAGATGHNVYFSEYGLAADDAR